MAARFARLGRPGIYFRVEEPGTVRGGHLLTLLEAVATTVTIHEISQLLLVRSVAADRWGGSYLSSSSHYRSS